MPAAPTQTSSFAKFDLSHEITDSEQKKPWQSGLYAKTLYKSDDFRTVLITMQRAAHMKEHHTDGTISIQVLKGSVRVNAQGQVHELVPYGLFTLAPSIKHDVEALEDAAFLLTISWPSSEKLRSLEHRGYGS
ncbi:MAG TPA: AraC family ligand binding domain-containing protein [Alloacidobacterium sp.]|nr:AraC family ligand binding domain-containing protein [Alloacidobacterium sp.]